MAAKYIEVPMENDSTAIVDLNSLIACLPRSTGGCTLFLNSGYKIACGYDLGYVRQILGVEELKVVNDMPTFQTPPDLTERL